MTAAISMWVRAVLRDRRRAALGLVALTFLASLVPLVAAAGARRTATSLERTREQLRPADVNIQLDRGPAPDGFVDQLRAVPGVDAAAEGASILARPVGTDLDEFEAFGQGGFDATLGSTFERARIDVGRLPTAADEVFVSRRLARRLALDVGEQLQLETFSPAAIDRMFAGEPAIYDGPKLSLTVVGIGRKMEELTGGADYPVPLFLVAPAFFPEWEGKVHWFDGIFLVRLTDGLDGLDELITTLRDDVLPGRDDLSLSPSEEAARVGEAVSTQATALALLALVALVTGGLAIAQAAVRVARSVGQDLPILAATGFAGRDLRIATVTAVGAPVALGVVLASVAAAGASSTFPTGPARRVEPDPGVLVDLVAIGGVALLLMAVALAVTARAGRARVAGASTRPPRLGSALAGVLPSVAAAAGVRAALRSDRGPTAVPARSAMVALGAGVAGVVASLVFGASLARLVSEPARYGWSWDYEVALGDSLADEEAIEQARSVLDDQRITGALYVRVATRELGGQPTVVMGVQPLSGDVHTTLVSGRDVQADDEIVVGRTTLARLDLSVGDTIPLKDSDGPRSLRIVGQGLFPAIENEDPAAGAVVSLRTLDRLQGTDGFPDLFITVAPGTDTAALMTDLEEQLGFATGPVPPPVISNLDLVDQSPYLLAAYLALLGVAVSAHAVLMTIRQRRGELAVLKTLGFARRQVATTVLAQSLTIGAVGVLAGLPLGLAAGRLAWRVVAGDLGFAVDPRNPLGPLAAVTPGALLLVFLIAAGPAVWIARARPAMALRTE